MRVRTYVSVYVYVEVLFFCSSLVIYAGHSVVSHAQKWNRWCTEVQNLYA